MVVFMLSVRVFSCMCPDCVACIVFAGFCFFGLSVSVFVRVFCWFWSFCLACIVFVRSFVCPACSVGFGRSVWLVVCLFVLLSVRLVLLVLVVLSGLYCFVGLAVCCVRVCLVCVSAMVSGLCVLAFPSGRVVLFSLLCGLVLFSFPSLSFSRLLFFGVPFLPPTAGAVRPACAPCGARAFPFPLVFPYRRPRARRRMMRMPWYSPRAKRRMARTASRRPCARPARVVPAGEAGRRAGRRVSSGSGVVSGV